MPAALQRHGQQTLKMKVIDMKNKSRIHVENNSNSGALPANIPTSLEDKIFSQAKRATKQKRAELVDALLSVVYDICEWDTALEGRLTAFATSGRALSLASFRN